MSMVTDYLNELIKQFNLNINIDLLFEYKSLLDLLLENPLNKFTISYKTAPITQPIEFHYDIRDSINGVFIVSKRHFADDELDKVLKVLEIVVYASLSIVLELKIMESYNIHILIKKRSIVRQLIDSLFKYTQPQQQLSGAKNKYSRVTEKMESQLLSTSPSIKSFPAGYLLQQLAKDDQSISSNIKSALNSLLSHNSSFDGFFNHQSIPVLHSTHQDQPQLSLISYYSHGDMRLIAKLLQLSEYEDGYYEQYTHFTWRLEIGILDCFAPSTPPQQSTSLPQPDDTPKQSKSHISNHDSHSRYSTNTIKTWIECTICKSCTPRNNLSEGAQLYSFGKYLELLFYSNSFLPSTLCDHARRCLDSNIPSKTNFVRWFDLSSKSKLIKMTLHPVNPFDIKGPKIQIKESQSNTSDQFQYPAEVERFRLNKDLADYVVRSTRKDIAIYFTTEARGCLHDLLRDYYNHIASNKKNTKTSTEPESAQLSRTNSGTSKSMSQAAATLLAISQASNGHYNANAFQQPATISAGSSPLSKHRLTPAAATANRIKRLFDQQELDLLKLLKEVPPEHSNDVRRKLKETSLACKARLAAFKSKFIPDNYYNKNEQRKKEKEKEREKEKEKEKEREKEKEKEKGKEKDKSKDSAATTSDSNSNIEEMSNSQSQSTQKEQSEDITKEKEDNDYLNNPRVHAFPGSSILVREEEPSSIISYALSSDVYLDELQKMKEVRLKEEEDGDVTAQDIPAEEANDKLSEKDKEIDKEKDCEKKDKEKDKEQQQPQTEVNWEPDSEDPAAFANNCNNSWTYSVTRREGTSDNPGGLLNLRMLSSKRSIDSLGMLRLRSPSSRPTSMMSDSSANTNAQPPNFSIGPSAMSSNPAERQTSNSSNTSSHRMSFRNASENSDGDAILENLMSAEQPEQLVNEQQPDAPVSSESKKSHKRSLSVSSDASSVSNTAPSARQKSPGGLPSNAPSQPIPRRVSELSQNSDSESTASNANNDIYGKSWTSEPENALTEFEQSRKRENANKTIETLKEEEEPQEDLASLRDHDAYSESSEMLHQSSNMSSSHFVPPPPSSAGSYIDDESAVDDTHKSGDSQVSTTPTLRPSLTSRASSSFSSIFALGKNREDALTEDQLHAQPSLASLLNDDKRGRSSSSRMDEAAAANASQSDAKEVKESPHIKYEFGDRTKFGITIYFAEEFDALRRKCGVNSQLIHSLSRSLSWRAEGGKTKANFSKTVDERFVIKQLTTSWTVDDKHALLEWAPAYFKHVESNKPTLLCKIFGFYSIKVTPPTESKSSTPIRMDLLVMENLFHSHSISTVFDLKGIEGRKCKAGGTLGDADWEKADNMNLHLIHSHSKHIIEEALKNDTQFLMDQNIMDYSFLIGVDLRRRELVVGIIDAIGAFTIAKYIESAGKHSKQAIFNPTQSTRYSKVTVLPPIEYQRRFLQAMDKYFLPCPDKWTAIDTTKDKSNDDVDTIVSSQWNSSSRKLPNPI